MKLIVIISHSPQSAAAATALRLIRCWLRAGRIDGPACAVFFYADGVYHLLPAQAEDGLPAAQQSWRQLQQEYGLRLLTCSAALARRLPQAEQAGFEISSLSELMTLVEQASQCLNF